MAFIPYFYLILYGAALLFAGRSSAGKAASALAGGIFLMGGAMAGGAIWSASQTAIYATAAVLWIAFLGLALPAMSIGIGLVFGATLGAVVRSPSARRIAASVLIIVPIIGLTLLNHTARVARAEHTAQSAVDLASFQQGFVAGTMEGFAIRLPAGPQYDIYFTCPDDPQRLCRAFFATGHGRLQDTIDHVEFAEIILRSQDVNCNAACLPIVEVTEWCDRRPDLQGSVWCDTTPRGTILIGTDVTLDPELHEMNGWTRSNHSTDDITVYCRAGSPDLSCRAQFTLSGEIRATVFIDGTPSDLKPQVDKIHDHVTTIWSEMVQTAGQATNTPFAP